MLAAGIAHDFNNFYTGMIGDLSLAKMANFISYGFCGTKNDPTTTIGILTGE